MKFPVGCPSITDCEIVAVVDTLRRGRITQGEMVQQFEAALAAFLRVKHAVVCSSGTAALHLSLTALGFRPGDEVLVPDLSYVATANAVTYTGATPVLIDVDLDTWNINLIEAARRLSSRTRAIIPVHLYGVPCDMDAVKNFADEHDLYIIEDAAEALGGCWRGHACGTLGLCGVFSFYANKVITTGEGGAIVTNDDVFAETVRHLRGQGQSPIRKFWHSELGYNYRLTDMQAAIGLVQLGRAHEFLEKRQEIINRYCFRLRGKVTSPQSSGTTNAPWLYTGLLPFDTSFATVYSSLEAQGIEVRPVFVPMHRLPMYARPDEQFPISCYIGDHGISLPTYPDLELEDVDTIAHAVLEALS